MERYKNLVKLEQIRELVRQKRYALAYEPAKTLDVHKMKASADISLLVEVFSECGDHIKAKECLLEQYGRGASRTVLMQLINLSIRLKEAAEAEMYYQQFSALVHDDLYSLIFRYSIDKLENKPLEVLIDSLKRLKETEYIEEWAYELAKLYYKAGNINACEAECTDIIIWFGMGEYVTKAKALRAYCRGEDISDALCRASAEEALHKQSTYEEIMSGAQDTQDNAAEEYPDEADEADEADYGLDEGPEYLISDVCVEDAPAAEETPAEAETCEEEPIEEELAEPEVAQTVAAVSDEVPEAETAPAEDPDEPMVSIEISIDGKPAIEARAGSSFFIPKEEDIPKTAFTISHTILPDDEDDEPDIFDGTDELDKMIAHYRGQYDEDGDASISIDDILSGSLKEFMESFGEEPSDDYRLIAPTEPDGDEPGCIRYVFTAEETSPIGAETRLGEFLEKNGANVEDYFGYLAYCTSVRNQLVKAVEILLNPQIRNTCVAISGPKGSGKTTLVKGLTRMLFRAGFLQEKTCAVTDARKVNAMDIRHRVDKLLGKSLVIENAGQLTQEAAERLNECNSLFAGHTAVMICDTKPELTKLFRNCRDLSGMFPIRIHIPEPGISELCDLVHMVLRDEHYVVTEEAETIIRKHLTDMIRNDADNAVKAADQFAHCIIDKVDLRGAKGFISETLAGKIPRRESVVTGEDVQAAIRDGK